MINVNEKLTLNLSFTFMIKNLRLKMNSQTKLYTAPYVSQTEHVQT